MRATAILVLLTATLLSGCMVFHARPKLAATNAAPDGAPQVEVLHRF